MHIDSVNYSSAESWHDTDSRLFSSWPTLTVSTVMLLWAWTSSLSQRSPMHLPSGSNNSCRIATTTQFPPQHPKPWIMDSGLLWDDSPVNLTAMCMTWWRQACVKLCKTKSSQLVVVPAGTSTSALHPSLSPHPTIDCRWVLGANAFSGFCRLMIEKKSPNSQRKWPVGGGPIDAFAFLKPQHLQSTVHAKCNKKPPFS